MHFDIVHAADPRYPGGTSSALRAELSAGHRWGLSVGLLPFMGRHGPFNGSFESRLVETIERCGIAWLTGEEDATCDILFAHHPMVFETMPSARVRIRPRRVVCVAHHPVYDGARALQYDIAKVGRVLERVFGAPVHFAPVGPNVRAQFDGLAHPAPQVLRHDLHNMIDLSEWTMRDRGPPGRTAVLGRHSRADPLKWPDTEADLAAAYPDAPHLTVKVLGSIPASVEPWTGSNWQALPFSPVGVPAFLERLDFYVYYHSRRWVEAFGISIAEAMASGLVPVLAPSFEALFEDGAVYAPVAEAAGVVEAFLTSPADYDRQSRAARALVERKFSTETYRERTIRLYEDLELLPVRALKSRMSRAEQPVTRSIPPPPAAIRRSGAKRRVLFVATNGIGLGHITRLMAIAERMSRDIEPVFFTRSAGSALAVARGHPADYIPSGIKIGVSDKSWNQVYVYELMTAIEAFEPSAVVFDGNYPFPGLLDVAAARPDLAWVWIRRGMWRRHHRFDAAVQKPFDIVIEPGELAADEDDGPTRRASARVIKVPPILLIDPADVMTRTLAAQALDVDPGRPTVGVQLGSQRNFEFQELHASLLKALLRHDLQVVEIMNPLASPAAPSDPATLRRGVYPLASHLNAFDLVIANSGYNSFHESIYGGIPTIFVPNEAPEMDDQHLRAVYAAAAGLAFCLRTSELGRVDRTIDLALSAEFRRDLERRSARLAFQNGAGEAARIIEQLVFSIRTDRPLHATIARA